MLYVGANLISACLWHVAVILQPHELAFLVMCDLIDRNY